MKIGRIAIIAGLVVVALGMGVRFLPLLAKPSWPVSMLTITSAGVPHKFTVEVARTQQQQEYGLMFRRHMDADKGMIFIWDKPFVINMWMKNTYLPLDMVFLDETGKVTHVAANAKPESLDIIPSVLPAKAVIELNAGVAQKLGITMGDMVQSPDLPPPPATP